MTELSDVVQACENQLGWRWPEGSPPWKARAAAIRRLQTALDARPDIAVRDLHLAIAWCVTHRQPIHSPAGLLRYIPDARAAAVVLEKPSDLAIDIDTAVAQERARTEAGDPDAERWLRLLIRAQGSARADVLNEWREARYV